MSRRRSAAAAVVVGAAALLTTLPAPPQPDVPTATATPEPVSRSVLVCPPGRSDGVVRVATVVGLPATAPRAVELTVAQQGESPLDLTSDRGEVTTTRAGSSAVLVRGAGSSARGLVAVRAEPSGGTLTAAGCLPPRPTWWFSGAGGGVDHSSVLFLTNADEGPAVVDVRVHGASGSVDEAGTRGITLPPAETVRLPLAEVAPGSDELTVEVAAARGRVTAHVLDTVRTAGGEGREWLPPSADPGEQVVLPGIAADVDRVRLLVTNPAEEQALVDLQVLTENGSFVPLGTEQLSVDPRAVQQVDLTDELEGRTAAVRLVSKVPVTGAVRMAVDGDVAYAGTAAPLAGPSGILLVGDRSEVQVAAGDEAVSLQLLLHDARGRQLARRAVTVPPTGLTRVPVPDGAAYAVLEPRSGGGHATAVHTGPGLAAQSVTPLPSTVLRSVVLPWTGEDDG